MSYHPDNIFAGTQVVSLVEVCGTNNSLVHPRGAVDSDADRRGIYLAPAELQWSLFGAPEQFVDNATQSWHWELQKFLAIALKANPNILECLYSPMVEKVKPLPEELLAVRQQFLSQMIFQTFNGYTMSQFKNIEQDIRNHGEVRWKHVMRLLLTGAATRLRMRLGRNQTARDRPDYEAANRFLLKARREMAKT